MPTKPKIAPEFEAVRAFVGDFSALDDDEKDIVAVWAIGTWTFSPAAPATPAAYPYLYITGGKGSGKTILGQDVLGGICRNHENVVQATGPALFRMLGDWDEESGEIIPHFPTLSLDEIDATYSGSSTANEALRGTANAGYKMGATIPRAKGKVSIRFPVYCPKALIGIDNGHLPETLTDRCIRIEMKRRSQAELNEMGVGWFLASDEQERITDLQDKLAHWAKQNAMILRDYRPDPFEGIGARQWEIARPLIQLAKALGIEKRIRDALHRVMTRTVDKSDPKVTLYKAIWDLFEKQELMGTLGEHARKVTSKQLHTYLREQGITVGSMTGMSYVFKSDGVPEVTVVRLDQRQSEHPGYVEGKVSHRGYTAQMFDEAFVRYLTDEDEE